MTYAEYLKSLGASDEDIKILDTPLTRKGFETQQASVATANELAEKRGKDLTNYQNWYTNEANPAYKKMETELLAAKGDSARARAILQTATDQGLIDAAQAAGLLEDNKGGGEGDKNKNKNRDENVIDPRYVTNERLLEVAQLEGNAIAMAQDIASEHLYLFGSPLRDFRKMREEATQRKISVEQVWMERYKVPEARTAKEAAARKTEDDKIRLDERQKVETEFATKYGDPSQRPPVISTHILTPRPAQGRDRQPWETNEEALANSRVARALKDNVTRTQ